MYRPFRQSSRPPILIVPVHIIAFVCICRLSPSVPRLYPGIVSCSPSTISNLQLVLANTVDGYELRLEDCLVLVLALLRSSHDIHTQHTVRRDRASATAAVRPVRLDSKLALLARTHVEQALVPTLDDLALANGEAQRLATVVRSIELATVALEGAAVVDLDAISSLGGAVALDLVGDFRLEVLYETLGVW